MRTRKRNVVRMDESFDPLKCNEDLPSSPGCHMDYGKVLKSNNTYFFPLS